MKLFLICILMSWTTACTAIFVENSSGTDISVDGDNPFNLGTK